MSGRWIRDSSGYYMHTDFPGLFVRSTNQVGYCRWEVVGLHKPARRVELLGRYGKLSDAKRTVEQEGARWIAVRPTLVGRP